jgi:hypothetical protein
LWKYFLREERIFATGLLFANGCSWQNLATTHYQNTQELAEIDLNFWIVRAEKKWQASSLEVKERGFEDYVVRRRCSENSVVVVVVFFVVLVARSHGNIISVASLSSRYFELKLLLALVFIILLILLLFLLHLLLPVTAVDII